jgi:hypothetical protein
MRKKAASCDNIFAKVEANLQAISKQFASQTSLVPT